jgi:hypothetical protein
MINSLLEWICQKKSHSIVFKEGKVWRKLQFSTYLYKDGIWKAVANSPSFLLKSRTAIGQGFEQANRGCQELGLEQASHERNEILVLVFKN